MRILHVITSLSTGGAEHLLVDLLPKLRDLGNDVELLLFDGNRTPFYEQLEQKGIIIHSLGIGGNVYNLRNIFRLTQYLNRYDIVHTHNTACQLFAPIAKLLSLNKTKLITTEHSANNRRRDKWYLKPIDKWMYSHYAMVICISDKPRKNLEKHIGLRDNITTIFNGVNISRFLNPIKDISKNNFFQISQVSSFNDAKDQDTLVRAINELPECYKLRLIGNGPRRKDVEKLVDNLKLFSKVDFLGIRSDIPELLRESDINVLSSHWEGLSLSSIEGMASGRPFVASNVDGLREVVEDAGVLFPQGDYKALAKVIKELCKNPQYYKEVAARCQKKAIQYDINVMAEKYNEIYKSL